jgi:hypothetical protein
MVSLPAISCKQVSAYKYSRRHGTIETDSCELILLLAEDFVMIFVCQVL